MQNFSLLLHKSYEVLKQRQKTLLIAPKAQIKTYRAGRKVKEKSFFLLGRAQATGMDPDH